MGNEKFHTFDIATLAAPLINIPDDIKELAYRFEDNVVIDMNAAGLGNHFYWYTQASKTIEAEVYDYRTGQMTTGTKTVPTAIKEGNPDEGITDPSVALLPAISVLFESRAPQTSIDRLPRVHGHVMAATSILNSAANYASQIMEKKDTFVVHMDQTAGTHAALSLEPLGNRSYANYWLSRFETGANQSGPHGGKSGFIPAIQGEEFQVYRYIGDECLNTYPIILDHPFVDNTMIKQLYPLTDEEINDFTQLIRKNKNSEVNYLNHFQILQPFDVLEVVDNSKMPPGLQDKSLPSGLKNRPLPSGLDKRLSYRMSENAFRLLLPKSIDGKSLDNQDWYLYD